MTFALMAIACVLVTLRVVGLVVMYPTRGAPACTPRQLKRAYRRQRADLRAVLSDRKGPIRRDL